MKKLILLIAATLVIASCKKERTGSVDQVIKEGNLETIKAKRNEVLKSYDSLSKQLSKLEEAIAAKDPDKKLPLVTTYTIKNKDFKHFIDIQGDVETKQNLLIYPEYSGVLENVYVSEGQKVRKGQLLAKIDDGGLSNQLVQLQTQLQLAKTTYERQKRLWDQKIGSEIQYLQAKASYESQQSAVNQVKAQLAKTRITAPFNGSIDEVIAEQGSVVSPATGGLMRIVNLNNMYVKAAIPENYLGAITKNATVSVTFPSLNKTVDGTVRQVSDYIDPNNRTFSVEIDVENKEKDIKPNLIAKLAINDYENDDAILIPDNIIQENAKGEKFVFVINNKNEDQATVKRTKVTTGLQYNNTIEITSGLKPGEVIVKDGAVMLRDGISVKIKESK